MLFVGDDWAEGHHDIEIVDDDGKVLVRRRLSEGLEGVTRLHSLSRRRCLMTGSNWTLPRLRAW